MKKTRLIFVAVLALLVVLLVFVACNGEQPDTHRHVFDEWTVLKEASCSEEGLRHHHCKVCGEEFAERIPMLEHTPKIIEGRAATCTQDGLSDGSVCEVCNTVLQPQTRIVATGHDWVFGEKLSDTTHTHVCANGCGAAYNRNMEYTDDVVAATCEADGYTQHTCTVCEFTYRDAVVEKLGHAYGTPTPAYENDRYVHKSVCANDPTHVLIEACEFDDDVHEVTCVEDGFTEHTCRQCGGTYKDGIVVHTGHSFTEWRITIPATCVRNGEQKRHCEKCSTEETEILPMGEHSYTEWQTIEESTCTVAGSEQRGCENCTLVEKRAKQLKPHSFNDWHVKEEATCDKEGVDSRECQQCQFAETKSTAKKEHVYGNWYMVQESTCTVPGIDQKDCENCDAFEQQPRELKEHTSVEKAGFDAKCEEEGRTSGHECSVCGTILDGYITIPQLNHSWGAWHHKDGTDLHERVCANDPEHKQSDNCLFDVNVIDADCDSVGYTEYSCRECENSFHRDEKPALGHSYDAWKADIIDETAEGHTHTHTHYCRRCDHHETVECVLEVADTIAPTCTVAGHTNYVCNECHSVHESDIVEASGHQYVYTPNGTVVNGKYRHTKKCANCRYSSTEWCTTVYHTVDATCETEGYTYGTCELCNREPAPSDRFAFVKAYGHDWTAYQHDEELSADGQHTHSRHCQLCSTEQRENCVFVDHTDAPTCLQAGSKSKVCIDCSISIDGEAIQPLNHNWGPWQVDGDVHYHVCLNDDTHREEFEHKFTSVHSVATCEEPGKFTKTCQECEHVVVEVDPDQPALGHDYKVISCDKDGHHVVCQNDETHVYEGAHEWSESNLCKRCDYDGLTYTKSGAHYVVSGNANVANSQKIIIPAYHKGDDDVSEFPVIRIKESAFGYSNGRSYAMTEVVIPHTVETIGYYAFFNCLSLGNVTFETDENGSASLTSMDFGAFMGCKALASIELPDSLTELGQNAFQNCENLKNITASDALVTIGVGAFEGTEFVNDPSDWQGGALYLGKHLISVSDAAGERFELSEDAVSISAYAFSKCTTVRTLVLHNKLVLSDRDAFKDCTSLEEVIFQGSLREWMSITFVNDYSSPLHYAARLNLTEAFGDIVIPEGVTSIPAGTFRGTQITGVTIGPEVTSIGEDAFRDCESLVRVSGAENVTYIGADAFTGSAYYNNKAENWSDGVLYIGSCLVATDAEVVNGDVTIRTGTKAIAPYAFKDCKQLNSITIPAGVENIGEGFIQDSAVKGGVIFVDKDSAYFATTSSGMSRALGAGRDFTDPTVVVNLFKVYNRGWRLLKKD